MQPTSLQVNSQNSKASASLDVAIKNVKHHDVYIPRMAVYSKGMWVRVLSLMRGNGDKIRNEIYT